MRGEIKKATVVNEDEFNAWYDTIKWSNRVSQFSSMD